MRYRWPSVCWMAFFCAGYMLTFVHGFPLLRYYPAAHAWGLEGAYPDPGMTWFGKLAAGCLAGLIGWTIGAFAARIKGAATRPPLALDIVAWVLVCAAAAYTAHYEWAKWM